MTLNSIKQPLSHLQATAFDEDESFTMKLV